MLNVDAVTTQVKDVTLFILDQEGNYIVREEVDSLTFHQNECTIQVPSLPQGDYTFLVWAGLADSLYRHTPTSLTLLRNEAGEQSEKLSSLFHGRLDNVHISGEYQVLALSLTKNTNSLSCILQSQSAAPLDTDDFRLELTARNGCMDHRNTPTDPQGIHGNRQVWRGNQDEWLAYRQPCGSGIYSHGILGQRGGMLCFGHDIPHQRSGDHDVWL